MPQLTNHLHSKSNAINELMLRIYEEFDEFNERIEREEISYEMRAARNAFVLSYEYAMSAAANLANEQYVAGSHIRANIENLADILYVQDNQEYAENYVEKGMMKFSDGMRVAFQKSQQEILDKEALVDINLWVDDKNKRIVTRIQNAKEFPYLINAYDYYCYFAHPNPGITYFLARRHNDERLSQIAAMIIDNCYLALHIARVTVQVCKLKSVTIKEIDDMLDRIGTGIIGRV